MIGAEIDSLLIRQLRSVHSVSMRIVVKRLASTSFISRMMQTTQKLHSESELPESSGAKPSIVQNDPNASVTAQPQTGHTSIHLSTIHPPKNNGNECTGGDVIAQLPKELANQQQAPSRALQDLQLQDNPPVSKPSVTEFSQPFSQARMASSPSTMGLCKRTPQTDMSQGEKPLMRALEDTHGVSVEASHKDDQFSKENVQFDVQGTQIQADPAAKTQNLETSNMHIVSGQNLTSTNRLFNNEVSQPSAKVKFCLVALSFVDT